MAKYDPLRRFLRRQREETVRLTFDEIERIISGILPHAAKEPDWWANARSSARGFTQCSAWLDAGFHATPEAARDVIIFRRSTPR